LEPKNPLYCNNMATVLVDQGRIREALGHLRDAHGEAAAYYNLGYLLNKKGQTQTAMQYFALAVKADPSMEAARRWLEYLQSSTGRARMAQLPMAAGVRVTSPPTMPQPEDMLPPEEPMPQRLPPTAWRGSVCDDPPRPGVSYDGAAAPAAPLPPPLRNAALRPLPRVY
jgi:tetratricopeptide (TPR) repeat protein